MNTKRTSHFFSRLPREIRDQIYRLVLVSPTGYIIIHEIDCESLVPKDPTTSSLVISAFDPASPHDVSPDRISLSLLQVCKQAHEESRNIFWKHNTLCVQNPRDVRSYSRWTGLAQQLSQRLMHIELHSTSLANFYFYDTCYALETVIGWSKNARLKSIVFVIDIHLESVRQPLTPNPLRSISLLLEEGKRMKASWPARSGNSENFISRFKQVCSNMDGLSLDKKIIVKTGYRELSKSWIDKSLSLKPGGFLTEWHSAFKGELWVSDQLIYKDGVRIQENSITREDERVT